MLIFINSTPLFGISAYLPHFDEPLFLGQWLNLINTLPAKSPFLNQNSKSSIQTYHSNNTYKPPGLFFRTVSSTLGKFQR